MRVARAISTFVVLILGAIQGLASAGPSTGLGGAP
jgi:hypothetical protein